MNMCSSAREFVVQNFQTFCWSFSHAVMDVTLETRAEPVKMGERTYEPCEAGANAETVDEEVDEEVEEEVEEEGLNEEIADHSTTKKKRKKKKKKNAQASVAADDLVTAGESETDVVEEVLDVEEKDEAVDVDEKDEAVDVEEKDEAVDVDEKQEAGDVDEKDEAVDVDEKQEAGDVDEKDEAVDVDEKQEVPRRTCVVVPSPGQSPVPSPSVVVKDAVKDAVKKGTTILGTASTPISSSMDSRKAWCLDIKELSVAEKAVDREIPYGKLVKMTVDDCEGIDWERREDYLSEQEFVDVFKMTRDAFKQLVAWRRLSLKKKVGLF